MKDPVKFLCDAMGVDGQRHPRHSPGSLIEAINSGQLFLDPDLMATSHGADVLNKLISSVCAQSISLIIKWDQVRQTKGPTTMDCYEALVDRLVGGGIDPWMPGRDGKSPWQIAVSRGWEGAALHFLQHPSCPKGTELGNGSTSSNRPGEEGDIRDPWIVAAARHDMTRLLPFLLDNATQFNGVDFTGNSALHHASSQKAVDLLLQAGIDAEILNNAGVSAEKRWMEREKRGDLDAKQSRLMAASLLLKRSKNGDPKSQAADLVAQSGQHMGVRDGSPILRNAGWLDPKKALTSKGQTIFSARAEDAINNGFRSSTGETFVNASEYMSRVSKIVAWLDRGNASEHDQGIARLMLWSLRGVDRSKDWNGDHGSEIDKFEQKIKLSTEIHPREQQQAIDALTASVARGSIQNGSYAAALGLASVLSQGPNVAELFVSHEGRDPLLIQWLDLIYRGMADPAWHTGGGYMETTRPDLPVMRLFEALGDKIDLAGDEFWSNTKLPGLLLRFMGSHFGGNAAEVYTHPLEATYVRPSDSYIAKTIQSAERWIGSIAPKNLLAEASSDPVSGAVFHALRTHLPEVAALAELAVMQEATVHATAPTRRRGL